MTDRAETLVDGLIIEFDKALRTLFVPANPSCVIPGNDLPEAELSDEERRHSAALMRVNHSGEICAQALYRGQAVLARSDTVRLALNSAAREEGAHLAWTERRLCELGGRKSVLNPVWYAASFSLGLAVGKFGDVWSLGFMAETERQVESHLNRHLSVLPGSDRKSRAVIEQMKADEISHAHAAERLGGGDMTEAVKAIMRLASGLMTRTAYWV